LRCRLEIRKTHKQKKKLKFIEIKKLKINNNLIILQYDCIFCCNNNKKFKFGYEYKIFFIKVNLFIVLIYKKPNYSKIISKFIMVD